MEHTYIADNIVFSKFACCLSVYSECQRQVFCRLYCTLCTQNTKHIGQRIYYSIDIIKRLHKVGHAPNTLIHNIVYTSHLFYICSEN